MKIEFKKNFLKQFDHLQKKEKIAINEAIGIFLKNPLDIRLKNHKLSGKLHGKRAISAGYDLRIVFEEKDSYARVILLAVGTHSAVY